MTLPHLVLVFFCCGIIGALSQTTTCESVSADGCTSCLNSKYAKNGDTLNARCSWCFTNSVCFDGYSDTGKCSKDQTLLPAHPSGCVRVMGLPLTSAIIVIIVIVTVPLCLIGLVVFCVHKAGQERERQAQNSVMRVPQNIRGARNNPPPTRSYNMTSSSRDVSQPLVLQLDRDDDYYSRDMPPKQNAYVPPSQGDYVPRPVAGSHAKEMQRLQGLDSPYAAPPPPQGYQMPQQMQPFQQPQQQQLPPPQLYTQPGQSQPGYVLPFAQNDNSVYNNNKFVPNHNANYNPPPNQYNPVDQGGYNAPNSGGNNPNMPSADSSASVTSEISTGFILDVSLLDEEN